MIKLPCTIVAYAGLVRILQCTCADVIGVPWESSQCQFLYGPPPFEVAPPISKVCWDSEYIATRVNEGVFRRTVASWPPNDRGSVSELINSAKSDGNHSMRGGNGRSACLSYRPAKKPGTFEYVYPEGLGLRASPVPPNVSASYVIIDEGHRAIYVSNLKSASSTITKKLFGNGLSSGGSRSWVMVRPVLLRLK